MQKILFISDKRELEELVKRVPLPESVTVINLTEKRLLGWFYFEFGRFGVVTPALVTKDVIVFSLDGVVSYFQTGR